MIHQCIMTWMNVRYNYLLRSKLCAAFCWMHNWYTFCWSWIHILFPFHCLVITLLQYVKGNVHVLRQTPIFDLHKGVIRIFQTA